MSKPARKNEIIDESKRIFRSWGSVEIRDQDGQLVPIDELDDTMDKWMERGAPISDTDHTDRIIAHGLKWGRGIEPETGENGIWVEGEVFHNQPYDDIVWDEVKTGKRTGLSWSGRFLKRERVMKDGVPTVKLHNLETYAFALCRQPKNEASTMEAINFKAASVDAEELKVAAFMLRKGKNPEQIGQAIGKSAEDVSKMLTLAIDDDSQADAEASTKSSELDQAKKWRDEYHEQWIAEHNEKINLEEAAVDEEKKKQRQEHPKLPEQYLDQISRDHVRIKAATIMRQVEKKGQGENMETNKAEMAAPPAPGAETTQHESEELKILKEILALLKGPAPGAGVAAEGHKADVGGTGDKLNAGAEGGKVKLPESVGEKLAQVSPDKHASADKPELSGAVVKAINEAAANAVASQFAAKSATPRPDAGAPDTQEHNLNPTPNPKATLGLAYEVATGKRKLGFRELQSMRTSDERRRKEEALERIRKAAADSKGAAS